jgi:hypothetical protein
MGFGGYKRPEYYDSEYPDPPQPFKHIDSSVWSSEQFPPEYWSKYATLQEKAQLISNAYAIHIVLLMDGRYRVYALLPGVGLRAAGACYGPAATDRNEAFRLFIEEQTAQRVQSLTSRLTKKKRGTA